METIGMIIGHRGVFPMQLCQDARKRLLKFLNNEGIEVVILGHEDTPNGTVNNLEDAKKCAKLFAKYRDKITGIIVSLPDFGDERSIAEAIRRAELNVPVLIQAFQDNPDALEIIKRRDSFCGKISVCNNLYQYGIKYSLTSGHTTDPESSLFKSDMHSFIQTCRIIKGLKNVRFGQIGIRPANFATVRYSEKLLEKQSITVIPVDLSDLLARNEKLKEKDPEVKIKYKEIQDYLPSESVPASSLLKMARLGVAIDHFIRENELAAVAIQCWSSLQINYGIMPCALMSILGNKLVSGACETDISGLVGMHALTLASQKPSALLDWNNNYDENPDKSIVFHCSNIPKVFFNKNARLTYNPVSANAVGKEISYGTIFGVMKPQRITYIRVTTDDYNGRMKTYFGEGNITNDRAKTFGGYGIIHIPDLQNLLKFICKNGYEHHVAVTSGEIGHALDEAFSNYLGYDTYYHRNKDT
jgi:L-fucose isomerase-like protein